MTQALYAHMNNKRKKKLPFNEYDRQHIKNIIKITSLNSENSGVGVSIISIL
jgi:hypothetical protein